MNIETWFLFFGTSFIATIVPGPSVILGLNHGSKYGYRKSIATALGMTTAAAIMGFVSLLGLGAVLKTSGTVFQIIKLFGATYLIYLGIKTWIAKIDPIENKQNNSIQKSPLSLYSQAILVGLSNPKAIIFFTAFFPQFLDPNSPQISQFAVIIITLSFVVFLCMMIYIIGGRSITSILRKSKIRQLLNRLTGGVFVGFGIGVALSK